MRITKAQLRRIIRESIMLQEARRMDGSYDFRQDAVRKIIDMLANLDDPYDQWPEIEDQARKLCKGMRLDFGPVFTEALQAFGIDY